MRTAKPAKLSRAIKFNDAMTRAASSVAADWQKCQTPDTAKEAAEGLRNFLYFDS